MGVGREVNRGGGPNSSGGGPARGSDENGGKLESGSGTKSKSGLGSGSRLGLGSGLGAASGSGLETGSISSFLVNPLHLSDIASTHQRAYKSRLPYPHTVIDHMFNPTLVRACAKEFPTSANHSVSDTNSLPLLSPGWGQRSGGNNQHLKRHLNTEVLMGRHCRALLQFMKSSTFIGTIQHTSYITQHLQHMQPSEHPLNALHSILPSFLPFFVSPFFFPFFLPSSLPSLPPLFPPSLLPSFLPSFLPLLPLSLLPILPLSLLPIFPPILPSSLPPSSLEQAFWRS